jgi:hypothetical protein
MLLGRPADMQRWPIPQAGSPTAFEALGPARFAMGDTVRFSERISTRLAMPAAAGFQSAPSLHTCPRVLLSADGGDPIGRQFDESHRRR